VYIGNLNNVVKRWGRFYKIFLQKVENCWGNKRFMKSWFQASAAMLM
jgi:hypothetical protein